MSVFMNKNNHHHYILIYILFHNTPHCNLAIFQRIISYKQGRVACSSVSWIQRANNNTQSAVFVLLALLYRNSKACPWDSSYAPGDVPVPGVKMGGRPGLFNVGKSGRVRGRGQSCRLGEIMAAIYIYICTYNLGDLNSLTPTVSSGGTYE